ncbi:MAG: amidohydrolase [Hyphomicrobiales bacterium]|nr:amidohydrolase [Hyphomicrobiales bacterium]
MDDKEKFPDWDRNPRAPVPMPPSGSCDCQVHVYEDQARYPVRWKIGHEIPDGPFHEAQRVLKVLGFDRMVLVHPSVYGVDYAMLKDILRALPDRSNTRGVVVVKDEVTDRELHELADLGVCGVRFHISARYEPYPRDAFLRTVARAKALGWHVRLHMDGPDLLDYADVLETLHDIPVVIDHMGRIDFSQGLDQPAMKWILSMLTRDNWWMMVSNGNRISAMEERWDDAVPFGKAFIEAAPDRIIWATDWPHVRWRKARMMNDAEEVELLYRYVDHDKALLQKILVDNPARLHGFK